MAHADEFSRRYGTSMFTICLDEAIMGFLLFAALTLKLLVRIPVSFITGFVGAAFGLKQGLD